MGQTTECDTEPSVSDTPAQVAQQSADPLKAAGELVRQAGALAGSAHAPRVLPADQPARVPEMTISIVEMSGDDLGELFGALAEAQGEFGPIERTLTARIKSKREGGADYSYNYAPLDEVLTAVRPALSRHGIAVMQFPLTRAGSVVVRTMLGHKSGQWIRNDCVVSSVSTAPQDVGGAITYARRYGLQAIIGVAPDHDDDGAGAQGRSQETQLRVSRGGGGQPGNGQMATLQDEARELVTACRAVTRNGKTLYGIKSTVGECWTDDASLHEQVKAAQAQERRVILRTEMRPGKAPGTQVRWLTELVS